MNVTLRHRLEKTFGILTVGILVASVVITGIWLLSPDAFSPEPFLGFLGLLYTAVPLFGRWVVKRLNTDLETERITLPFALAYGYLTNYLAPVVKRLRKNSDEPDTICFTVFIPSKLEELRRDQLEDFIEELGNRNFEIEKIELEFPGQQRGRDVRTARRLSDAETVLYFDFPTTLLTTIPAVELKLDSSEGRSLKEQKVILTEEYIREFKEQLDKLLENDDYSSIRDNIRLAGGGLSFLDSTSHDS